MVIYRVKSTILEPYHLKINLVTRTLNQRILKLFNPTIISGLGFVHPALIDKLQLKEVTLFRVDPLEIYAIIFRVQFLLLSDKICSNETAIISSLVCKSPENAMTTAKSPDKPL